MCMPLLNVYETATAECLQSRAVAADGTAAAEWSGRGGTRCFSTEDAATDVLGLTPRTPAHMSMRGFSAPLLLMKLPQQNVWENAATECLGNYRSRMFMPQ